jgi:hypothetical protein
MTTPVAPARKLPKAGIWWAIGIFVVTAIVGIVMIVLAFGSLISAIGDFEDLPPNEVVTVTVDEGEWTLWGSTPSGSAFFSTNVAVEDPNGNAVDVDYTGDFTADVDTDGRNWEFIGSFDADVSGPYRVLVDGPPGTEVRIGQVPIGRFLGLLFGGIAIGAVGFIVALVLLIVTLVRRSRAKKQLAGGPGMPPPYVAPVPGSYPPPAPGGYGGPPPAPGGYGGPPPAPGGYPEPGSTSVPPPGAVPPPPPDVVAPSAPPADPYAPPPAPSTPPPPPPPAAAPTPTPPPPPPPASSVPPPGAVPPPPGVAEPTPPPPAPDPPAEPATPPSDTPSGDAGAGPGDGPGPGSTSDEPPTPPPSEHQPPA